MSTVPSKRGSTQLGVREALQEIAARDHTNEVVTAVRHQPAREAEWEPVPGWVRPELAEAYGAKGIDQLYSHQARAAELARARPERGGGHAHRLGQDAVLQPAGAATRSCEDPDTRALYLFPTKALAQDQLPSCTDWWSALGDDIRALHLRRRHPQRRARSRSAQHGHIVVTNPDMLHTGILPHHTSWTALVREPALRRHRRAAHLPGRLRQPPGQRAPPAAAHRATSTARSPQFICCSATIANPGELAQRLHRKPRWRWSTTTARPSARSTSSSTTRPW